jgi:hypothetical protein
VPLLVVLLCAGLRHPLVDAASHPGLLVHMGDSDVGNLLPRLVGHSGHEFEDLELAQRAVLPVHCIEGTKEYAGSKAVRAPRRNENFLLCGKQLRVAELRWFRVCGPMPQRLWM